MVDERRGPVEGRRRRSATYGPSRPGVIGWRAADRDGTRRSGGSAAGPDGLGDLKTGRAAPTHEETKEKGAVIACCCTYVKELGVNGALKKVIGRESGPDRWRKNRRRGGKEVLAPDCSEVPHAVIAPESPKHVSRPTATATDFLLDLSRSHFLSLSSNPCTTDQPR